MSISISSPAASACVNVMTIGGGGVLCFAKGNCAGNIAAVYAISKVGQNNIATSTEVKSGKGGAPVGGKWSAGNIPTAACQSNVTCASNTAWNTLTACAYYQTPGTPPDCQSVSYKGVCVTSCGPGTAFARLLHRLLSQWCDRVPHVADEAQGAAALSRADFDQLANASQMGESAESLFNRIAKSSLGGLEVDGLGVAPDAVDEGWLRYQPLSVSREYHGNLLLHGGRRLRASRIAVATTHVSWQHGPNPNTRIFEPLGNGRTAVNGVEAVNACDEGTTCDEGTACAEPNPVTPVAVDVWRYERCPEYSIVVSQDPVVEPERTHVVFSSCRQSPTEIALDTNLDIFVQVNEKRTEYWDNHGSFGLWVRIIER